MSNKRNNNLISIDNCQQSKIVLVGGAYKTGTSLLTAIIEQNGAINPTYCTSPIEYGHSFGGLLYPTRECIISRTLNRKIVSSTTHERDKLAPHIKAYIRDMLSECGNHLVIKDPYFLFTSQFWAEVTRSLGITLELNLVFRNHKNTFKSWQTLVFFHGS